MGPLQKVSTSAGEAPLKTSQYDERREMGLEVHDVSTLHAVAIFANFSLCHVLMLLHERAFPLNKSRF